MLCVFKVRAQTSALICSSTSDGVELTPSSVRAPARESNKWDFKVQKLSPLSDAVVVVGACRIRNDLLLKQLPRRLSPVEVLGCCLTFSHSLRPEICSCGTRQCGGTEYPAFSIVFINQAFKYTWYLEVSCHQSRRWPCQRSIWCSEVSAYKHTG